MNREQASKVQVGDEVRIDSLWNRTSPPKLKILSPAKVVKVAHTVGSQTGVLITVATASGTLVNLDAGWFRA